MASSATPAPAPAPAPAPPLQTATARSIATGRGTVVATARSSASVASVRSTTSTRSESKGKGNVTLASFSARSLEGEVLTLKAKTNHRVTLVVNVASYDKWTQRNYAQLKILWDTFYRQGFQIIATPCNQFRGTEPEDAAGIREFLDGYGIEFPVLAKEDVNGPQGSPMWKWLARVSPYPKGTQGADIEDNFCMILIGLDGRPFMRFPPGTEPEVVRPIMERMSSATKAALAADRARREEVERAKREAALAAEKAARKAGWAADRAMAKAGRTRDAHVQREVQGRASAADAAARVAEEAARLQRAQVADSAADIEHRAGLRGESLQGHGCHAATVVKTPKAVVRKKTNSASSRK